MDAVSNIPYSGPTTGIRNNLATEEISMENCINALSTHLGSPLVIDGLPGIDGIKYDEDPSPLTHLMFYNDLASRQRMVLIHLIRNDEHLTLKSLAMPHDQDPLNTLCRAVATAAEAARTWDQNTLAANDNDTQALRQRILSRAHATTVQATTMRTDQDQDAGDSSSSTDTAETLHDEMVAMITVMLRGNDTSERPVRNAGQDANPHTARITGRRPHIPVRAMPAAAEEKPVAAPRRGIKRQRSDEAIEAIPTEAAVAPVSVASPAFAPTSPASPATATGHPDRPASPPTPP
jgi:hypothetical protein